MPLNVTKIEQRIKAYQRQDNFVCLSELCNDLDLKLDRYLRSKYAIEIFQELSQSKQEKPLGITKLVKLYPQLIEQSCIRGVDNIGVWVSPSFIPGFLDWIEKITKKDKTRTEIVKFRVTPKELVTIDANANRLQIKRSDWIRQQCLDNNIVITPETIEYVDSLKAAAKELAPIGNNINQIARQPKRWCCNQGDR